MKNFILNFLIRAVFGILGIYLCNNLLSYFGLGIYLGINVINLLTIGILGFSGFGLIFLIAAFGIL